MPKLYQYKTLIGLLLVSFFSIVILHVFLMNSSMNDVPCADVAAGMQHCPITSSGPFALADHLGSMQSFFVVPQVATPLLLAITVFWTSLSLLFLLLYEALKFLSWRQFFLKLRQYVSIFYLQLASWLTLLEKRDPAHHKMWGEFSMA